MYAVNYIIFLCAFIIYFRLLSVVISINNGTVVLLLFEDKCFSTFPLFHHPVSIGSRVSSFQSLVLFFLPSGVTTANDPPLSVLVLFVLLPHTVYCHVLSNHIHVVFGLPLPGSYTLSLRLSLRSLSLLI